MSTNATIAALNESEHVIIRKYPGVSRNYVKRVEVECPETGNIRTTQLSHVVSVGHTYVPEILYIGKVSEALAAEKYLHTTYTTKPTWIPDGIDGYSEFRELTEKEIVNILAYLRVI